MSGRHSSTELTKDFTPGRRQRIDDMKADLLAEMPQPDATLESKLAFLIGHAASTWSATKLTPTYPQKLDESYSIAAHWIHRLVTA